MRIYWTNNLEKGNIGMMARPKGNDWFEDEILKIKQQDVSMVVSLLERQEIRELELDREENLCIKHGIKFINFPIEDRSVPQDIQTFTKLIYTINENLTEDKKIVIHCRMGIGRTSVVAAATLLQNGMDLDSIFDFLSDVRTLEVPDTEEQIEWIKDNINIIHKT